MQNTPCVVEVVALIALGDVGFHANTERFRGSVPVLPHLRPPCVPGGMWGRFGKPLKRAVWNTLGLHAVLTVCLRFPSGTKTIWSKMAPFSDAKTGPFLTKWFSCGDRHFHILVR